MWPANKFLYFAVPFFATIFLLLTRESSADLAGIAHIAFRVRDVSKSLEFYQKLGFEQAFAFVDSGKPPVSYVKINDRQFIELYGGAHQAHPSGLMHVCYEVKNIESLMEAYTVSGVNPPPARKARAGNMLMLLHDPEGEIVEFTQYLPDSLHFEDRGKHLGEHRISRHLIAVGMDVRDLAVEKAFYTSKLGFEEMGVAGLAVKLRLPGDSGEQIELEGSKPDSKPRIVFETASVSRASEELRQAGFDLNPSAVSVAVSDPDGTFILFVQTHDPPTEGNK